MTVVTTSMHSRRKHVACIEWAMWLVWKVAWLTGAARAGRSFVRAWRERVQPDLPKVVAAAHRLALRLDMAIGDLLVDGAGRIRRRAPYVVTGVLLMGDLFYLAVR